MITRLYRTLCYIVVSATQNLPMALPQGTITAIRINGSCFNDAGSTSQSGVTVALSDRGAVTGASADVRSDVLACVFNYINAAAGVVQDLKFDKLVSIEEKVRSGQCVYLTWWSTAGNLAAVVTVELEIENA